MFAIYLPAAKAGFVADFTGWLEQEKYHGFLDNLNRTGYQIHSMYQLTQLVTYILYRLIGTHAWLWYLVFVSLHAANAALAYMIVAGLLQHAGEQRAKLIAATGAILFSISPYISEPVVWEPAYHFLQGLLLSLIVLRCVQLYITHRMTGYLGAGLIVYLFSLFSLEVFYLTPVLVLLLAVWYEWTGGKGVLSTLVKWLLIPQIILAAVRLLLFRLLYGDWVSRIGSGAVASVHIDSLGKPAKYLFHLLLLGRFFPNAVRQQVYAACDSSVGMLIFYGAVIIITVFLIRRFAKLSVTGKAASLLFLYVIISLLLLIPLWFFDAQLVVGDRYIYFASAFFYMLVAVLAFSIRNIYMRMGLLVMFALANMRYAIQVSRYWGKSERVTAALLSQVPANEKKTFILLNVPQNMHGVPMIGAEANSEFKLMHDLLLPGKELHNTVYDAQGYNMETPQDGAHVRVVSDSVVQVTLNQWGTWWWFEAKGGHGYENSDYRLDLTDPGHWYRLTLKHPASQYLLFYQVGDKWKTVDMRIRDRDQE